ncbi:kinectin-like isoform X3 [Tachysurus ichikawai]
MSKERLTELLSQSIDSTEGAVVNFRALHLLLYNLVNRHGAERETADRREADVGRDVTESLSDSDTSEQMEDSEEGVSKVISSTSLMQDIVKENKELKEEANNLKDEVGTLREQLNQCVTLEYMQNMLKELKDNITSPGISDISREVYVFPTKKDQLQEMDKSPEALVEHLEGEREYILSPESMSESSGEVEELSKSEVTAIHGSESISGSEQQIYLQTADLRNAFQKLYKEVQKVKQELLVLRKEQKGSSEKEMKDKLDSLQSIQDNMSLKTSELFQCFENLQSIVTGLINDKATEQTSDVQGTVLKLQAECEKLHSTTTQLMKEQEQEQSHTKEMYKFMKELDEKKADKDEVKIFEHFKADMQTLETKVLLCDTAADQLNRMIQDLAGNICDHEENSQRVNEKIFRELDSKINHTEMDRLKRQLEECKMKVFQLDTQAGDSYDAAVVRKHCLPKFNCLSCDRPLNMSIPGPSMLVLPEPSGLRHTKRYKKKRLRQLTNLDQSEKSTTLRSIEQTRETDRCGLDVQFRKEHQETSYVKTAEVRVNFTTPTGGYSKNKDKVNHSQLQTSIGRKPRQLLSLQEQGPKTELICSGSSCLENNKQLYPEDTLP